MNITNFVLALPGEICAELGRRARERRLTLNLSAEELAQRAGITNLTLRKFETTGRCRLETFVCVLEALNVTTDLQNVLAQPTRSIHEMRAKSAVAIRKRAYRKARTAP